MIKLLLFSAVLATSGGTPSQTPSRAESKQPLSEAVEKVLTDFVQSCVPEKRKQLITRMEMVFKALDSKVTLTDAEKAALQPEAEKAVDASLKTWQPLAVTMMRTYLSRTSDAAAIRHIGMWKPEVAGPGEPVENWTPPEEDSAWLATLKTTLGETRYPVWQAAEEKRKKETTEKISAYLERWVAESRGPLNEDLHARIELMKKSLSLSDSQVAALTKASEALLDRLCSSEKNRAADMLGSMTPAARTGLMGRTYFYIRFDRPRGAAWDKAWDETASKILSPELMAHWNKVDEEERGKADKEAHDLIRPTEQQAEQQMTISFNAEIDGIVMTLNLPKERQQALEALSKEAIQESLKLSRQGWLQQARNYSPTERKRIRGNIYFGINEEQQASKLPVWKDGLKKILSEAERAHIATDSKQRDQRTGSAISRTCLAELDKTLALTQDQRQRLEPLLREQVQPLLDQRRQQYWSYSATQLLQAAGKMKESVLRPILDDVQWKHWKEITAAASNANRGNSADANSSTPEAPDMEIAISQFMYKMFVAERTKSLAAMMPQVEEAARLLSLPEPSVARLTTAAKGAVESSLAYWRQNTERYVRQSVQTANSKNILQALAGIERVNYSRTEDVAHETELWKAALKTILSEPQQKKIQEVSEARKAYRLRAMAAMSVSELDRRRRLSDEQCAQLETALHQVLADYLPDIERYMSNQWFLQYYYALVPLAGVPEKDMQKILTPEQWKLCKERDLPDAMQYWDGIQNNHQQRLKQRARAANGNQPIFNGGIMIDE